MGDTYLYKTLQLQSHEKITLLCSDNDVVDGDMDEFDKKSDETHKGKPYGGGDGDFLELFPVKCLLL